MSERGGRDDAEDVAYEIKRARLSPSTLSPPNKTVLTITPPDNSSQDNSENVNSENMNQTMIGPQNLIGPSDISSTIPPPSPPNPCNPIIWVQKQIENGVNPMSILVNILPSNILLPEGLSDLTLWRIVFEILSDMPRRVKLPHINTLHDVVTLLKSCRNILVVTGAGISVSCGIPDFRSRDGIYARLSVDYPDLPNPQAMFDIEYFQLNPQPFFKFAMEIWPGQFTPSPSHRFIKHLENEGRLLRNYTQNIDTLENVCGINNVIQCHGSFASARCRVCGLKVEGSVVKEDIMKQKIPLCTSCPGNPAAIMKPDIVFFGEGLPNEFHKAIEEDRAKADLVIVMGSSLKVKPVAHIPNLVPPDIPQILINREPLQHMQYDVELLGDCDLIIAELCNRLNWKLPSLNTNHTNGTSSPSKPTSNGTTEMDSDAFHHVLPARYLFPGAELPDEASQADSLSEEGESEEQSGVTTEEDEDTTSDNYVAQMRYAMGCTTRKVSENPGPSGLSHNQFSHHAPPYHGSSPVCDPSEERWDTDSVSNVSVAAQMGDSREPSIASDGDLEEDLMEQSSPSL